MGILLSKNVNKIPVIMYHAIQGRTKSYSECSYEIKEGTFENQIIYLKKNKFTSILFKDLLRLKKIPPKSIIITFDDGHLSNYKYAFPILKKHGFKAVFFVTPGQFENQNRMKAHHLREMASKGMEFGSHGMTHAYLDDLKDVSAHDELIKSKRILSNIIEKPVIAFSAPGGRYGLKHVNDAVDIGYKIFCTSRPGLIDPEKMLVTIPRIPVSQQNSEDFKKIVTGKALYYLKKEMLVNSLDAVKKIMGNKRYDKIRSYILSK